MTEATSDSRYDPRLGILHADMDAFFAAVEVLDDPSLAGRPLIIGHPGRRGVVSTASYEARRFGVHSAMPSLEALRRCPDAVWRPPRLARYAEISRRVRGIFRRYTPHIEPLSLDEAFLDVFESLRLFGGAERIANAVQRRITRETGGLTVSVGVAENKFLAKLASDLEKPNGITVVPAGGAVEFLAPLPVTRLWGVGPRTAARLRALGFECCSDLVRAGEKRLLSELGPKTGRHLFRLAQGIDRRDVETVHEAKSLSTEATFAEDLHDPSAQQKFLFEAADVVSEALRRAGLKARTVQLKVRTGSFRTWTRAVTLEAPTDVLEDFYETAVELLKTRVDLGGEGVRLLGLGAKGLLEGGAHQKTLFDDPEQRRRQRTAEITDRIRAAYGSRAMLRGRSLPTPEEPGAKLAGTPFTTPRESDPSLGARAPDRSRHPPSTR